MEARKRFMSIDPTKLPDPPMPSYTFFLYSRDLFEKSKFKDYDALLENKLARCQARADYLASILENRKAIGRNETLTRPYGVREKVPKTTSTHFVDGEYVASFTVGSEQIKTYLLIDTGSDLVWWQCGPCKENWCFKQKDPLYVSTNSKTYRQLDCIVRDTACLVDSEHYQCTEFGNFCLYDYKYLDGARSVGWIADDVITFVLDQHPVRIIFGCGKDQTRGTRFNGEYSGIAGIGRRRERGGGNSLPTQFEADIMALCLPGIHSPKGSTISFHTTPFKKKTSAKLLPYFKFPDDFIINLYKVFINDKEVPLHPSIRNSGNGIAGGCIVDTGTVVTRFPQDFYTVFRYIFRQEVKDIPLVDGSLGPFDTCYTPEPGKVPSFPVVKLYFDSQSPNNLLLLAQQRVMVHIKQIFCLGFMAWDQPDILLGSVQLQGIGLTFDTAADILSFDIDACE